jgi:nucleotide-binding universal stress UspA family protein
MTPSGHRGTKVPRLGPVPDGDWKRTSRPHRWVRATPDGRRPAVDDNTIVVGVDGSQPSHAALRWAAARAERSRSRLLIVHVLDGSRTGVGDGPDDSALRDARALLETERGIAASAAPGVTIDTDVTDGDPVWSLVDGYPAARQIVVGSHKTGFLRGASFGSRSLQLAAAAAAPVVVVPPTGDPVRAGVVVGVDESPDGRTALEFGVRHARAEAQELILVRCVPSTRTLGRFRSGTEDADASAAVARARRRVADLDPDLRVRSRIVHGDPAQALIRASTRAALLVVGRSQGDAHPSSIGRVTHDVLLNLGVATVVVGAVPSPSALR